MILFAADRHYDAHCGRVLYDAIAPHYDIDFHEDDWACFCRPDLADRYDLMVLNLIAGSCDVPPPAPKAEEPVRNYVAAGRPLLLLHGASAAFWELDWWRPLVGHRWVRGEDPDGMTSSTHPKRPYRLEVAKSRHPLCARLQPVDLPEDEIYIDMEQTCPTSVLMTTTTTEGTFPQCYEARTPAGGAVIGYVPGHRPEVVGHPTMVANCRVLIDYLLRVM